MPAPIMPAPRMPSLLTFEVAGPTGRDAPFLMALSWYHSVPIMFFDTGDITHQAPFQLANDPGQFGLRPVRLQGAHQRHDMTGVAERGGTQQA